MTLAEIFLCAGDHVIFQTSLRKVTEVKEMNIILYSTDNKMS